jgi:L-rhamnose-H+ transport protein
MGLFIGLTSSLVAGVLNGSFAAPMKKISNWEWENTWFIYALVALLILPFSLAYISVPGLGGIYAQIDNSVIFMTLLTGFLYGIGSVTFGLGLHLAGLSLGYSLMIGLISVTGSLVPMLIISPESVFTTGGFILLSAMAVSVIGVIFCGKAGAMRAKSQLNGESRLKVPFKVAFTVCAISGIFSSMLNISLVMGLPIAEKAQLNMTGILSSFRAYNAVWLITLSGAVIPYLLYCVFLFVKNKSVKKYKVNSANFFRSGLMGLLWFSCIFLYGAGASNLGKLGITIGWLILMAFTVIVGNLWGFFTGEWDNAPLKAKKKMITGLLILLSSVVLVAIGKFFL